MRIGIFLALSLTFILVDSSVNARSHRFIGVNKYKSLERIASFTNEPRKCRSAINSVVKNVQKTSGNLVVKRVNIHRNLSDIWSNAPKGDLFDLDIGGNQKIPWFRDNKRMKKIAATMIKNCPDIVGVAISTEGDYLYTYGLVNGAIKKFTCPSSNKLPFRWGFYNGECS